MTPRLGPELLTRAQARVVVAQPHAFAHGLGLQPLRAIAHAHGPPFAVDALAGACKFEGLLAPAEHDGDGAVCDAGVQELVGAGGEDREADAIRAAVGDPLADRRPLVRPPETRDGAAFLGKLERIPLPEQSGLLARGLLFFPSLLSVFRRRRVRLCAVAVGAKNVGRGLACLTSRAQRARRELFSRRRRRTRTS